LDIGNEEVVDQEQKLVIAFAYLTTQTPLDALVGKVEEEARAGDEREEAQRRDGHEATFEDRRKRIKGGCV
jgi:hypothetical protein